MLKENECLMIVNSKLKKAIKTSEYDVVIKYLETLVLEGKSTLNVSKEIKYLKMIQLEGE